ncbi:MAG: hypothetical protein NTW86_28260 [Candidatus Sumerlaeota bacterium]|nr:hypothetical protein [Candidatus Sumerlaeota bacterium]
MASKEKIVQDLDRLADAELEQLARFLDFLKHQARLDETPADSEQRLAAFYAESAEEEDRERAEEEPDEPLPAQDGMEE